MKKLNLIQIFERLKNVIARFPAATFFCVLLFVTVLSLISRMFGSEELFVTINCFQRLLIVLPLGYVLAVNMRLFSEDKGWPKWTDWLVVPLMALYFFTLPSDFERIGAEQIIRIVVFNGVALLLMCVAPWFTTKSPQTFWQYNIKLLGHLLLTALSASIFFGALALALGAISLLFGVHIRETWFFYLAAFFYALVTPLLFAGGIPDKAKMTETKAYSGVRAIGEYVLVPVLAVYLLIFYVYGLKILFTWELPNGWLTWMVLAYSGVGMFTYALLHNYYSTASSRISVWFGSYFFYTEIPLLLLLFLAIFRRSFDYGITENRYYIILMAFWLLAVTVYMAATKGRSLRPIVVSFVITAILSLFGPWSAFNVSNRSQFNRLKHLMTKNDLLKNGKFYTTDKLLEMPQDDYDQIQSIIYYFGKKQEADYIQPLFNENIDSLVSQHSYWSLSRYLLGDRRDSFDDTDEPVAAIAELDFSLASSVAPVEVRGYDFCFDYSYYDYTDHKSPDQLKEATYVLRSVAGGQLELYHNGQLAKTLDLPSLITRMIKENNLDLHGNAGYTQQQLSVIDGNCKIIFKEIRCTQNGDTLKINFAGMWLLVGKEGG